MPRVALTDLSIRHLKAAKQTQFWDASLKCFGVRVNPKGTKTFNVMLGKDRRLIKIGRYGDINLKTARRKAHELIDAERLPTAITFPTARDRFIREHLSTLKASTAYEQTNLMLRFPFDAKLSDLTLEEINGFLGKLAPGSARSHFNILRTFCNWSVQNDLIEHTPLRRSPYKARARDRVLGDHEIMAIWAKSFAHGQFGRIWRCLLLSGQRLNQFASFDRAWVRDDRIVFPPAVMKSNEQFSIPLTRTLIQHLPELRKPFTNLSDSMNRLRAALPQIPHHTCHDARRTFSTKMAEWQIASIDTVEALLDHRTGSRSPIQRIYDRHDRFPQMKIALEVYEQRLFAHVLQCSAYEENS